MSKREVPQDQKRASSTMKKNAEYSFNHQRINVCLARQEGEYSVPLYVDDSTGDTLPNVYHDDTTNRWVLIRADRNGEVQYQRFLKGLRCPYCESGRCLRNCACEPGGDFKSVKDYMYVDLMCTCTGKSTLGLKFVITRKVPEFRIYEEVLRSPDNLRCPYCLSLKVEQIKESIPKAVVRHLNEIRKMAQEKIKDRRLSQNDERVISRIKKISGEFSVIHQCKRCKKTIIYGDAVRATRWYGELDVLEELIKRTNAKM